MDASVGLARFDGGSCLRLRAQHRSQDGFCLTSQAIAAAFHARSRSAAPRKRSLRRAPWPSPPASARGPLKPKSARARCQPLDSAPEHPPPCLRPAHAAQHASASFVAPRVPESRTQPTAAMVFLGIYRAIYDYVPQSGNELALAEGDVLMVLEKSTDDDWWKAKKKGSDEDEDEPEGLIPNNYIEEVSRITPLRYAI